MGPTASPPTGSTGNPHARVRELHMTGATLQKTSAFLRPTSTARRPHGRRAVHEVTSFLGFWLNF